MVRLTGWKKIRRIPPVLDEGDTFHGIWYHNSGLYLFIIDYPPDKYLVGTRYASSMDDEPKIIRKTITLEAAKRIATTYMKVNE